jgi:RIO kinase 1
MEENSKTQFYDMLDDECMFDESGSGFRNPRPARAKKLSAHDQKFVSRQDDSRRVMEFTYQPARFEEGWLLDSLGYFLEQKWISDVLRKVKGGKEASVYLCRAGSQVGSGLLAAKVFRPRMLRNLKNDRLYLQGREVLDEDGREILDLGMLKAHHNRTMYGESIRHQSWIMHEYLTLKQLHEAGADVPRPYETSHNAILMDYIGSEEMAAPPLNTVILDKVEAEELLARLAGNLEIMLELGLVHGDLSAYNVLYWCGDPTIIDFPQVIFTRKHPAAFRIFRRDLQRLCAYFQSQGVDCQGDSLAAALWKKAGNRIRPEVNPAALEANDPAAARLWQESLKAE